MIAIRPASQLPGNRPHSGAHVQLPRLESFAATIVGVMGDRTIIRAARGLRLLQQGHQALVFLPPSAVARRFLRASDTIRIDDYGLAVHLHIASGGHVSRDAIWYYPGPDPELAVIAGMLCVNPARFDSLTLDGRTILAGDQPGSWIVAAGTDLPRSRQGAA